MTAIGSLKRSVIGAGSLALILTAVIDIALLVVPIYDMQLYDRVLMSRNLDTLAMLSVACAIGLLFYATLEYLRSATFIAIADAVARKLHQPAFDLCVKHAAAGDKRAGPELIRNIHELQSFLGSGAVAVPLDALCAPLFVIVLFMLHPAFGWLALVGIASLIIAGLLTEGFIAPNLKLSHERRRKADFALSRSLTDRELTEGLGMFPALARRWVGRYSVALQGLNRTAAQAQIIAGASRFVRLILQAGVMALGAILIIRGQTTPGSLMGANLLLNKCLGPFDSLIESCRSWMLARQSWRGLASSFQPGVAVRSTSSFVGDGAPSGLSARALSLSLPSGETLLSDISFDIGPGTLAVIAGPNGGGKTTLLRVLAGIVPPTGGYFLLDGLPASGGATGYLPQAVSLLDGTVADNIGRFAPELDRVLEAARAASVHEMIGRMGRGYDTRLTNDGSNLSGGMRQRIGLARALYGAPRLLLLDEPDASLDADGSAALLRALRLRCAEGAVAIVISHRPALRQAADLVITMKDGRVTSEAGRLTPSLPQLATA